ncbi:MAG: YARHG domain-containing protein [Saprospiraceae bacterium]|nr:YARHG domain-containing protein [Saprospiraceae bacterium]
MKINLLYFFPLFLLVACNPSQPTQNQDAAIDVDSVEEQVVPPLPLPAVGMFVGEFLAVDYDENKDISYSNKITMAIETLENGVVKGYSIVAGNSRPFEGTYAEKNGALSVTAREPGDDKYDGAFTFQMHRDSQNVSGSWEAFNRKLGVTKRTFNLEKRVFQYDPNLEMPKDGITGLDLYNTFRESEDDPGSAEFLTEDATKFNASKTLLRKEDVENMHKGDLEVIRNAIYARHGYSFKNRRMRYLFDRNVDWYMPVSTNVSQQFTALERKNIDLLKRYEQHAASYYDSFGR